MFAARVGKGLDFSRREEKGSLFFPKEFTSEGTTYEGLRERPETLKEGLLAGKAIPAEGVMLTRAGVKKYLA